MICYNSLYIFSLFFCIVIYLPNSENGIILIPSDQCSYLLKFIGLFYLYYKVPALINDP